MNERIQKLSDIADSYARSDNSSMLFENYKDRYTSKLSELIIQEYTHELQDLVAQRIPASEYASLLKEKFGAEK